MTPNAIDVIVHGTPAPQGSKRYVGKSGKGRANLIEDNDERERSWREAVKTAVVDAVGLRPPWDGPVRVTVTFTVRKPASAPKRRRTWPVAAPDLDKYLRSTLDAITDAGCVWASDAQVVVISAAKVYPDEDPNSLPVPGARISVCPITEGDQ